MRPILAAPGLLTVALVLTACGAAAPSDEVVVRDSAGVRIVENPLPDERVAFVIDAEPELSIGMLEGPDEYTFQGIRALRRLQDGRIVVADVAELKLYDPSGRHLATVGRQGEGPGEFSFLNAVVVCGGELLAGDMRQARITAHGMDGTFLRTIPVPATGNSFLSMGLEGCDAATGRPLLRSPVATGPGGQPVEDPDATTTLPVLRLDPATGSADTVALVPARTMTRGVRSPMAPDYRYAFAPDGVHVLRTDAIALHTYGPDGALRRIVRVPHTPRPLSADEHDRAIDERLAQMPAEFAAVMGDRMRDAEVPAHMPAASMLATDAANRFWIRPYAAPWEDPADTWHVLAPDGAWLGTARLPAGFTPMDIGEDWVLGTWVDELEVGYVRLYRFRRG